MVGEAEGQRCRQRSNKWRQEFKPGWTSLMAQMVKRLSQCGRPGFDPWVGKIPWRRKWQPTLVLLPRKSYGWRSLVQATVHGVPKSRTRLSDFTFTLGGLGEASSCLGVKILGDSD